MWEPGGGSSSSSTTNNRGVFVLLTTLSVCVLLYKAWGPLLFITCALVLVLHTCYSLLVNDSLFAPHTLVLLRYAKDFGLELILTLKLLFALGFEKFSKAIEYLRRRNNGHNRRYSELLGSPITQDEDMNGRQRNVYRLSTSGIDLSEHGTSINHDPYHSFSLNGACDSARTSTPIPRGVNTWRKGIHANGDLGQYIPISTYSPKKCSVMRSENKQPTMGIPRCEETLYSAKGSPWSNSISPKMRDRTAGMKAIQNVAGPLLSSSRYNIDPKIYIDVSSPGLTSRLTKYASEASNKLIHQPQYAPGQFPKVNLHASPTPLLNPKIARARVPVTVRVAPPEIVNYSPILDNHPHQDRHKIFSNNPPSELQETASCPSMDPVLKKMSLKRHASREDMLDLAKKQRAEKMYYGQLENLEEMMQKRARDESLTSDEDLSPQSKTQRPSKRPKASSCHDILHSLSSSLNVFTGVKRKANDTSRCNTPDIEKHFKPSTRSPNKSASPTKYPEKEVTDTNKQLNVKVPVKSTSEESHQQKTAEKISNVPKTSEHSLENQVPQSSLNQTTPRISKTSSIGAGDSKLTDKLFMRPEPQTNEKLKTLIEEQGNVEVKFTTDDKDEIKKQDIVNMRQNSMRLRLQSMFDAISGKSANKIDPDVVIQAEEVNLPTSSSTYASLSSLTSTTTVNASPIATTIVPILKSDTESKSPTTKHVTFDLPASTSSLSSVSSSSASSNNEQPTTSITTTATTTTIKSSESKPVGNEAPNFGGFSSSAPPLTFNFGSAASPVVSSDSVKSVSTSGGPAFPKPSVELGNPLGGSISIANTTTPNSNITSISSNVQPKASSAPIVNSAPPSVVSTTVSDAPKNPTFSSGFTFGGAPPKTTALGATFVPTISFTSAAPTGNAKSPEVQTNAITTASAPAVASTGSAISSFGNPLLKSPASTSIAQPTTASSISDKKFSTPGGFSFGTTTSSTNSSTTSITPNQTVPTFNVPTPSSIFSSASLATTSAASLFTFGAASQSTTTSGFSFGAPAASTPSTAPSTGFGAGAQTPNTGSPATFSTSSTSMGSHAITAASSATPTFGNSTPSLFGTSNPSPSLFSGSSSSGASTIFKSPLTTTSATTSTIFGSPSGIPNFGATTPSSSTSTPTPLATATTTLTTTPNLFGNVTAAKPTTTIPSLFGNVATTTASTGAVVARSAFGDSTSVQQQQQPQPSNIFSGMNATTSGPSSIFGSSVAASASNSPAGLFSGSTNASQNTSNLVSSSNPAEGTNIFGQPKTSPSMSFGTTNSSFGQAKPLSTFGQTKSPPSFGMTNPSGSNTSSTFQMGSSGGNIPTFNAGAGTQMSSVPSTSIFGSGFGSTSPAGSSTSTGSGSGGFGAQGNTTTSTFGSAAPSFGSGSSTSSSPFGSPPATNQIPSLFGNVATPNAASFTFGAAQPQQQQQQQQAQSQQPTASFSFGGSSNPSSASMGGLFQFGGSSANKPAGFNFNAPMGAPSINFTGSSAPTNFNAGVPGGSQGAPPSFSAPQGNMFSIGSSSSTPRSRTSRQRRQR